MAAARDRRRRMPLDRMRAEAYQLLRTYVETPARLPGATPTRLLPFNGAGRFRRDVVDHTVDSLDLVDDAVRHGLQQVVREPRPVGGHGIVTGHRSDDDGMAVGSFVA